MYKIIHLSDTHIVASGASLYGIDPARRLREVFEHIAQVHPDSKAIVITGDLADHGDVDCYVELKHILSCAPCPVHLTLGNHDQRDAFRSIFGGTGYVQSVFDSGRWRIILLDTLDDYGHGGCLDQDRLDWLESQLVQSPDRLVLLAMHHPPLDLGMPSFSSNHLDSPDFRNIVKRHSNIRHMLFGHMHVAASGSYCGIPFTLSRGVAHHISLDLMQTGRSDFVAAAPSYNVVLLGDADVVVHCHDGFDTLPVLRPGDRT